MAWRLQQTGGKQMIETHEFETVKEWYEPTDALRENEGYK